MRRLTWYETIQLQRYITMLTNDGGLNQEELTMIGRPLRLQAGSRPSSGIGSAESSEAKHIDTA